MGASSRHAERAGPGGLVESDSSRPGARRPQVVLARGFWEGSARWGLVQQGFIGVGQAPAKRAGTVDAQAQAATGEGVTVGSQVHMVRPEQSKAGRTARLAPEVVGLTERTSDEPSGTPEPGLSLNRRAFQPKPLKAGVVRKWPRRNDGPGGPTVVLTKASVQNPRRPCDDEAARSLHDNCGSQASPQHWNRGHRSGKPA
jgi:hypothetical protein